MNKFQQIMAKNPPHVFIKYTRGETREQDTYTYSLKGQMPTAQLVGMLIRVQAELAFRNPEPCEDGLWILTFNPNTGKMDWFVDTKIPVDALVGTIEIIKCTLVDAQVASMVEAAQKRAGTGLILGSR